MGSRASKFSTKETRLKTERQKKEFTFDKKPMDKADTGTSSSERPAQMAELVAKLQAELAEKDARIARLARQAKEATDKYEMEKQKFQSVALKKEGQLIEKLQLQIQALERQLDEKDAALKAIQRLMMQTNFEKESQMSGVKDSIEKIIREKDTEIRRLKALWSPNDTLSADTAESSTTEEISQATKHLNAPELGPYKTNSARFGISAENRTSSTRNFMVQVEVVKKTLNQRNAIRNALQKNVFLKGLDEKQVDQLIDCMSLKQVSAGLDVISEGEFGTHLYVLDKGQVEIYHIRGGARNHVADLKQGSVFGELAILYNCKRTASVSAKTDVTLWCLDRQTFQAAVKRSGELKREEYVRLLKTVEKLKSLSDNKLLRIADCLEEATFENGDYVIRQGDTGDTFYIIEEGRVKVTHAEETPSKKKQRQETFVCYLEKGQYFGESALLTEEKRSANVIVESKSVTVLLLDRLAFNSLVGPIADIGRVPSLTQTLPSYEERYVSTIADEYHDAVCEDMIDQQDDDRRVTIAVGVGKGAEEIIHSTPLEKLQTLKVLGQGGFGCVKLVGIEKLPRNAFALKGIRKAKIVRTGQQQHVLAEKNLMLEVKCPFIGRLYRTYQDELRIYLLMDAYLGGEVYGTLRKLGPLSDYTAKFCSACVLEAFSYLHASTIVYRDLKPENLMLDHRGYVKLVDFGFAKQLKPGFKTWTFCGTPEYFPPEILANTGHDYSADLWSFGILIYELLTRTTPFFASDDMTVYENILSGMEGVRFSKRIPKTTEALIRSLCKREPRDRLGYQKGGIGDIRKHRWYHGFDWQGLRANQIQSPFTIDVKHPTDTANFDTVKEDLVDQEADLKILKNANMVWAEHF